jgi:outer membrane beta-barrel protein
MKRLSTILISVALSLLGVAPARAAGRRNPLEGQPSIRHRLELRNLRFEVEPFIGFTILQDFNNTVMGGAKLQYHLTDWVGIGGVFGGGAAVGTGLKSQILSTLNDSMPLGGPPRTDAEQAMNHIVWMAAAQAEFTPFGGKFAMFSRAFFNYDFYLDGGAGFVNLKNDLAGKNPMSCDSKVLTNQFGCNDGTKIGPSAAAGVHMFFNDFMAFNLEYRAIVIKDNSAGRDTNGDRAVNDDDLGWSLKQFVTLGLSFFLPAKADISR